MLAMIIIATFAAWASGWRPGAVFSVSVIVAVTAFIPSCAGIMGLVDASRFGLFQYASYPQVQDFRVERYLPEAATAITLEKSPMGHRAKYNLPAGALEEFLERLSAQAGTTVDGTEIRQSAATNVDEIDQWFGDLDWPALKDPLRFQSPIEADGGGATYFLEPSTGTVYHRAGYW